MDNLQKENLLLDYILKYLKSGKYVSFTNLYMGNYFDGEKSNDRFKIKKENIKFVNGDTVRTIYRETLHLKPIAIEIIVENIKEIHKKYIIIDVTDWTIYIWNANKC